MLFDNSCSNKLEKKPRRDFLRRFPLLNRLTKREGTLFDILPQLLRFILIFIPSVSSKMELLHTFLFFIIVQMTGAELFPSFAYGGAKQRMPHKIILRSKRQSCICISVFHPGPSRLATSSNFQCSCDPTGQSTGHSQQQRELQKELSQFQQSPTQSSQCGCQLNSGQTSTVDPLNAWATNYGKLLGQNIAATNPPVSVDANGSPVYDCQCIQTRELLQASPTLTSTPVPTTSTTPTPTSSTTVYSVIVPQCQCVEIIIKFSSDRQFQCDCGQGPTIVKGFTHQGEPAPFTPIVDPYALPGMAPGISTTPNYVGMTVTPEPTTTRPPTTTTTTPAPTTTTTTFPTTTQQQIWPTANPIEEPDAMPCVMIQIRTGNRVCACMEDYKQCTETACCNLKKYRSFADDPKPAISPATATVDLLVDLLQKVRQSLV